MIKEGGACHRWFDYVLFFKLGAIYMIIFLLKKFFFNFQNFHCCAFFSSCNEPRPLSLTVAVASLCRAWALGCGDFSSCGSWAREHRLNSCGEGA